METLLTGLVLRVDTLQHIKESIYLFDDVVLCGGHDFPDETGLMTGYRCNPEEDELRSCSREERIEETLSEVKVAFNR